MVVAIVGSKSVSADFVLCFLLFQNSHDNNVDNPFQKALSDIIVKVWPICPGLVTACNNLSLYSVFYFFDHPISGTRCYLPMPHSVLHMKLYLSSVVILFFSVECSYLFFASLYFSGSYHVFPSSQHFL